VALAARHRPAWRPSPGTRLAHLVLDAALAVAVFLMAMEMASAFESVDRWGAVVYAVSSAVATVVFGRAVHLVVVLLSERRRKEAGAVSASLAVALAVGAVAVWGGPESAEPSAGLGWQGEPAATLAARGAPPVRTFTYGAGDDRRPEYGERAVVQTGRVDLSGVVPGGWTEARTASWGFDPTRLPLNARVWIPDGASGAPLVLLVHGTHDMRTPSEEGFEYLAAELARRGMVVASIDQNFLGYGYGEAGEFAWSDIQARAALILAHLEVWHSLTSDDGSPWRGYADLSRVLLVGHSRGGEAIVTAAARIAKGAGDGRYQVRALAALAPTENDGAEEIRSSYLAIHGTQDNDVEAFVGLRAFHRLRLGKAPRDPEPPGPLFLKAALQVAGANHSQFNSRWGRTDKPWPASLLEERWNLLAGWKQRRVTARVVAAFAEATLRGSEPARAFLRGAVEGLARDPGARARLCIRESTGVVLASFEEDHDRGSGSAPGSRIEATDVVRAAQVDMPLRLTEHFGAQGDHVLEVAWSRAAGGAADPRVSLLLPDGFGAGPLDHASLALDVAFPAKPPALELRLVDAGGRRGTVRLGEVAALDERRKTRFTLLRLLERPTAPSMLETVVVPLSRFAEAEPRLDLSAIRRIEVAMTSPADGVVRLDDLILLQPILVDHAPAMP